MESMFPKDRELNLHYNEGNGDVLSPPQSLLPAAVKSNMLFKRLSYGCYMDPQIVSKFHSGIHDPKGQEIKFSLQRRVRRSSTAATQSPSSALVKLNIVVDMLSSGIKEYETELKM